MTNKECQFYEEIAGLGLTEAQLSVVSSLFEACFPHPEAEWLFVANDLENDTIYTYRALAERYPSYKIAMEIKNGNIKRLDDEDDVKQYILDHKDVFYPEYLSEMNGVDIERIDDFDIELDEQGVELKPYIRVICNLAGPMFNKELFAVTLRTGTMPENIKAFNERYHMQYA